MSFATKICTSFIQNGIKSMTGRNAIQSTALAARNFHMMVKPFPKNITSNPVVNAVVSPISRLQRLLSPVSSLLSQVAGFKVKGRIKRRCKDCYIVVRQQRSYVICPTHPRHKQMSMKKRDYKSWILTHATQSKVRPY